MFVGVIGCGSIGKRHINNLLFLKKKLSIKKIFIYDPDPKNTENFHSNELVEICNNENQLFSNVKSVIISSPNHLHSKHALMAVKNNCNALIEKPFSHILKPVNRIITIAKKKKLIIMTGYMLRYYRPFIEAKKIIDKKILGKIYFAQINCGIYLPNWRPHLDYRNNYGAKRAQGGGVVLDIIHEINYAQWFFGEFINVNSFIRKLSKLEIDTEDFASINLETKNNIFVNLTLDYLNQSYNRNFNIVGEKGSLKWNFINHKLEIFLKKNKKWKTIVNLPKLDFNETYKKEIINFINSTKKKQKPKILIDEGKKDLDIVLAAFKSSKEKKLINL